MTSLARLVGMPSSLELRSDLVGDAVKRLLEKWKKKGKRF